MLGDPTDPQDPSGLASFEPHALPPSLTIPAVPHPNALKEISIAVSPSGVWLKSAAQSASLSYVYIPFGLSPTVTEVRAVSVQPQPSWSPSNTLYGVVGILNLFRCKSFFRSDGIPFERQVLVCTASYLLVISSRNEVGDRKLLLALNPTRHFNTLKSLAGPFSRLRASKRYHWSTTERSPRWGL